MCEGTQSGIPVPGAGGLLARGEGGRPPLHTFAFSCRNSLVKAFMFFDCSCTSGGMVFCTVENGALRVSNGGVPSELLIPISRPHDEATPQNTGCGTGWEERRQECPWPRKEST